MKYQHVYMRLEDLLREQRVVLKERTHPDGGYYFGCEGCIFNTHVGDPNYCGTIERYVEDEDLKCSYSDKGAIYVKSIKKILKKL